MNDIYDLVRRADGKAVYSFPVGGRYLVDTSNGIQSMRPLMEDEIIFTRIPPDGKDDASGSC